MTTRELRMELFNVTDQDLTVRELREILFEADQDEELTRKGLEQLTRTSAVIGEDVEYEYDEELDSHE